MAKLVWDELGKRVYELGLDRGVLYPNNAPGVPWNGLISVDDDPGDVKTTPYYLDGNRYYTDRSTSEYSATMSAFTYPDEFLPYDGVVQLTPGVFVDDQPVTSTFGLTYRTLVGNDVKGKSLGYKIHLLYNLTAVPSSVKNASLSKSDSANAFSWTISGVPDPTVNFNPSVHLIIDSRKIPAASLKQLEEILYGSSTTTPRLPLWREVMSLVLLVVDNGDGTWTATGIDQYIQLLANEQFTLNSDTVTLNDDGTATITSLVIEA